MLLSHYSSSGFFLLGLCIIEKMAQLSSTPPYPFLLPVEFAKLIQTIWTSSPNDVVSPSEFKTQIQRYAPRFVGYK